MQPQAPQRGRGGGFERKEGGREEGGFKPECLSGEGGFPMVKKEMKEEVGEEEEEEDARMSLYPPFSTTASTMMT